MDRFYEEWSRVVTELKQSSECNAMGWFNVAGELLVGNETMCSFLGTSTEKMNPAHFFVNPTFPKLQQLYQTNQQEKVFEGLLTVGNFRDVSFALNSKVFRKGEVYFVFAEADVFSLFENNKKMSELNQQVNNLQRDLNKEKKKLENTLLELQETQQMLIQSEKMNALGQLVAGIAHEINNPIAFVTNNLYELKNYSNAFLDAIDEMEHLMAAEKKIDATHSIRKKYDLDFLSEDVKDVLKESLSGVERVKGIVSDLRKFSRLDESDSKHIDLVDSLQSTISIIKPQLEKKMIDFRLNAPEKMMLDCFPGQLNQAILNILLNAIHAVDNKGRILLSLHSDPKSVVIAIEDNGTGIPESNMEKIFDPFFTTKPVGSGTGLGLGITYKIITGLHKGKITVKSHEGKGAIFTVFLPKNIES